jgi:protein tyrosine/serine phosphatase
MSKRDFWVPYMRAWRNTWSGNMGSIRSRFYAYLDMLLVDQGLFRCLYGNRIRVTDQVVRRSHPCPLSVWMEKRRGIKTIINLRGDNNLGSTLLSKAACKKYGITHIDFRVYSRQEPSKERLHEIQQLFQTVEYPILMHCKSGADRAGLMSALYLIIHEGRSVEEAKRQLKWYYGHIRETHTGILDYFLEAYERANKQKPIAFMDWVDQEYDPEAVRRSFKTTRWENLLDRLMNRE